MGRIHRVNQCIGLLIAAILAAAAGLMPASPVLAESYPVDLFGLQPSQAANDVDTPVEVSGSGFSKDGGVPQVFLGDVSLSQVTWVNESTLTCVIPWGLDPGKYGLRVVNPDGGEATLDSAFEVTPGVGNWNASTMDGGPVRTVIPIPSFPGRLYAYSVVTSAVYRSEDYGESWNTIGHVGGQFFTYDPVNSNYLYIDLMQSEDGGVTWRPMLPDNLWPGTDMYPNRYTQTFPDPGHSGTLFLATAEIPAGSGGPSGLLRSTDYGQTWTPVETGLLESDTNVTAIEFAGTRIYLGTRDGRMYQSEDGGSSWQPIGDSNLLESIGILKVNPYETNELWITTHFSVSAAASIIKLDLGNLENLEAAVTPVAGWSVESYPKTLGFLGEDTAFMASEWDNGWITEDDGANWELFQPSTGKPGYWLAVDPWEDDPDAYTFYMADEQFGVQKTTIASPFEWSNAAWTPKNQGLHAMSPDNLKIDPSNPARVYAKIAENGWPGIFVSDDGGQSWDFSSLLDASENVRPMTSMLAVSGERVFAGAHGNDVLGYGPQVYISDNQGGLWNRVSLETVPEYSSSFHMPWVLEADPQQPEVLLLVAVIGDRTLTTDQFVSEIYRSTTNGQTWQRVGLASQVGYQVNNISYLSFDPNDPDVVYASGDHEILKSTDNGAHWSVLLSSNTSWLAGPIAVEPVAPHRVYVGNLVSLDDGENWEQADMPFNPQQMAFVPGSATVYIAGDGLAYSIDGGGAWQRVDGPLGATRINGLAVGRVEQRTVIYVGTPGGETPAPEFSSASINAGSPSALEAGVYRMTEVRWNSYLPLVNR